MPADPIRASVPAQMAMATAIAAQIQRTTTAWPWLEKAGASPTELRAALVDLEASLRKKVNLASALAESDRDAYFDAAPTLARVEQWRSVLRQRLRDCDTAGPAAQAAATEIRTALHLDPLRLRGTLAMLLRVIEVMTFVVPALPASVLGADALADAQQLRADLLRCEATRRTHEDRQRNADADVKSARAALVAHLRLVRRKWRLANALSGGELPKLNTSAGAAEVR